MAEFTVEGVTKDGKAFKDYWYVIKIIDGIYKKFKKVRRWIK